MNIVSIRLNIDGQAYICDCYENESIQITKRAQTIEYVEAAQGVVTKQTFRMPLVGNLVKALGRLDELQVDLPYDIRKNIEGSVLVNDFPRFKGSFNILATYLNPSTGFSEVEMIFKGNETNLKYELTNITLKEMLAGEYLNYRIAEIKAFHLNPDNYINISGYAWPLIDYGQKFSGDENVTDGRWIGDTLSQSDFKPAIQIRKLFNALPITVEVDASAEDLVDQQFIPLHNNASNLPVLENSPKEGSGEMYLTADNVQTGLVLGSVSTPLQISADFDATEVYDADFFSLANQDYEAQATGLYTIQARLSINMTGTTSGSRIHLYIYKNGMYHTQMTYASWSLSGAGTKILGGVLQVPLETGDKLELIIGGVNPGGGNVVDVTIHENSYFRIVSTPIISATSRVDIGASLPELTAWDLVKTIATQCNGLFVEDTDGFTIVPWEVWLNDGTFLDISDMVEHNQQIKIEPTSVTAPKRILFTYEQDEDFLNKLYTEITGDIYGQLLIADTGTDFGTETKEIKVPFAATPFAYIDQTNIIIPKFVDTEGKVIKTKPRLLKYNSGQVFDVNIPLSDEVIVDTGEITELPWFGHWDEVEGGWDLKDYSWGTHPNFWAAQGYPNNTLYVRFWEQYIIETYGINARKLEMGIHITQNQFDKLKLNERVYWNGNILRFTAINNFDVINEGVTQAVLVYRATIEKIDIAPYYPYDVINSVVQWKDSSDNSVVASPLAAELEESAAAYGFYYDATNNRAIQSGQLLTT